MQNPVPTVPTPRRARRASQWPEGAVSPIVYNVSRTVARLLVPLFAKLHTEGLERIPAEGPVVLALNHIHWMDIPLSAMRVRRHTHFMAKIELFQIPILSFIIARVGTFAVRRGEGDREALRVAERLLSEGEVVVIFPEGHRSGDGNLAAGHPGAALIALRANVPIVAVSISGTQQIFKGLRYGFWAPRVTIHYSEPFTLAQAGGKRSRESLAQATDTIMRQIAAGLPPQNRGAYADVAVESPASAPISH